MDDRTAKLSDGDWREGIPHLGATKEPRPVLANALYALRTAPEWEDVLAYNEFSMVTVLRRPPPWQRDEDNSWEVRCWSDRDDTLATEWLHQQKIFAPLQIAADAIRAVAGDVRFHPIRIYLTGLVWDNTKRLDRFASDYLGAEATPYHSAVGRSVLLSAVARTFQPGCKADTVAILEGGQGTFKSTALEALFSPAWFTDDIAELGSKDSAMQMCGKWCIEVAELSSMQR